MNLDKLRPKQETKKKKSPIKIKVTNFTFDKKEGIELNEDDENKKNIKEENNIKIKKDKNKDKDKDKEKNSNNDEIKFYDEEE